MARNVYIVDDDDAVRASLHSLLSLWGDLIAHAYRSGDHFLEDIGELEPGLILLDVRMPGSDGIEVLSRLGDAVPIKFLPIMMTGEANFDMMVPAMKAGAFDILEKPYRSEQLLSLIDSAFTCFEQQSADVDRIELAREKVNRLSPRERFVLCGLIEGGSHQRIAQDLEISPHTVKIYRSNVMAKLGVRGLAEALRIAFAAGMITVD